MSHPETVDKPRGERRSSRPAKPIGGTLLDGPGRAWEAGPQAPRRTVTVKIRKHATVMNVQVSARWILSRRTRAALSMRFTRAQSQAVSPSAVDGVLSHHTRGSSGAP